MIPKNLVSGKLEKKDFFEKFRNQDCEKFDRNVKKCWQLFIKAMSSQARLIATKAVQGSLHIKYKPRSKNKTINCKF